MVNIKLPNAKNGLKINILNTVGDIVYTEKINFVSSICNYSFNLKSLISGMYFVSIEKDGQFFTQKLIIE